ncbi:hypothetical protein [Wolbachia endosymbiont of Ctenocephalides felis wCfeT]|uniref:hypothetical protein n=1 Tax=Wolbachia endosymbiont of Ctenocephalides felis wCfeT TaxID=2732593 RepID=UPI001445411E|nr:hypothetical protein [Wolbachia endosymbiont of Ctenocephalides felis wCfeT]
MKSVKLNFLFVLFLILGFACKVGADCPGLVYSNTNAESGGKKALDGLIAILSFGAAGGFQVDEKLYHYITAKKVKDQGIDGYFNPKIEVCDFEGKKNCYQLHSGTSCQKIYGTQDSGGGVSAAVFIDWEGDKTKIGGTMGGGLEWEWAEGVSEAEQEEFANSPKICACSQKGACLGGVSAYFARVFSGENIFRPGEMEKACDTCNWGSRGKQKIKCAPVPLAPGPPPFCKQLEMSPPQVRIVPITERKDDAAQKNDYFNPRVKVIFGSVKKENGRGEIELGFSSEYGKDKARTRSIADEGVLHYFKTYREKGKLCAGYYGTESTDETNLQFERCFPAPSAPEPKEINIVNENTLEVKIEMNSGTCRQVGGSFSGGTCTFNVGTRPKIVGPLALKVVKPAIVAKTTNSASGRSNVDNVIEGILENDQDEDFKLLKQYGYVPDIELRCSSNGIFYSLEDFNKGLKNRSISCELDNTKQLKIEIKYKKSTNSKMLCLSGWKPDPEEFILEEQGKITPLKLMGASYTKYNSVYSGESSQLYYFPCNKTVNILKENTQGDLDGMIFNKKGYISIPKENSGKDFCNVKKDDEMDAKQNCNKCKLAYQLIDGRHEEECDQGEEECKQGGDGYLCSDGKCSRSTQYANKKDDQPFYLKYKEVSYEGTDGRMQKGLQLERPFKANRAEVFYADKLCRFNLEDLKSRLRGIIIRQLKDKKEKLEEKNQKPYDLGNGYTDDLSIYDYVEIEAWGGGEAGHIKNTPENCIGASCSTESRLGMPGDYIKAKLRIDPNYPIIEVEVTEGGGGVEGHMSNKDGGPTFIRMCDLNRINCKPLITVAGGGKYKEYGWKSYKDTLIHEQGLKLEEKIERGDRLRSTEDKKVAYIENGAIKYQNVTKCDRGYANTTKGAGGCIDKDSETYSKGAPGYVKIKPVLSNIDEDKVSNAIDKMMEGPDGITRIDDSLINTLDSRIIDTIREEIRKELLGR